MDDPLGVYADVRLLECADPLSTPVTMRKQRKRVARELVEEGIVVSA
jgi:hypothetical protein